MKDSCDLDHVLIGCFRSIDTMGGISMLLAASFLCGMRLEGWGTRTPQGAGAAAEI